MAILEVKHLKKSYGEKIILNDINFKIKSGECLGVVGRSGCGKSTMARIIARFIPADSGQIILDGADITHSKDLKNIYRNMQMIFQLPEDSFDPRRTLGWSIGEPLRNYNFKNIDERIKNLLVEVGLTTDFIKRYPHEVSGGQCQRAAIARAISLSPKLLICDEATSALDVTTQAQIVKLLRQLCTEKNFAILFITHDLEILTEIADDILKL
jgi:ABC-type dipeptide/oligopeptide/nickel transport system ATPase subunit